METCGLVSGSTGLWPSPQLYLLTSSPAHVGCVCMSEQMAYVSGRGDSCDVTSLFHTVSNCSDDRRERPNLDDDGFRNRKKISPGCDYGCGPLIMLTSRWIPRRWRRRGPWSFMKSHSRSEAAKVGERKKAISKGTSSGVSTRLTSRPCAIFHLA